MELYMWAVDSQDREMENVRRVDRRLGETEEQVGRRAARYATRVLLLDHGRLAAAGTPVEVVEAEIIGRVYRWPVAIVDHPGPGPDAGAPQVVTLAGGSGSGGSRRN